MLDRQEGLAVEIVAHITRARYGVAPRFAEHDMDKGPWLTARPARPARLQLHEVKLHV